MQFFVKKITAKYRYTAILLLQFVKTDFKIRYQNSILGYLWSLLRPLALFSIMYVVFVRFLKVGDSVPNFAIYLLLGIVLWNFFVEITSGSVASIVNRGDILRKISFPRYVIVLAGSFSAVINLSLNLIVVAFFMIIKGVNPGLDGLLAPFLLFELYVFALAIAFLLSAAYVRLRDLNYVWEVIMQGAFYAVPVFYPFSLVLDRSQLAAKILISNPVAQSIQDLRYVLVTDKTITIGTVYSNGWARLIPIATVVLFIFVAGRFFRSRSRMFAEDI